MTNDQKFKTAEERVKAFGEYCYNKKGCEYKLHGCDEARCFAHWLALEAEEKPETCPFCGEVTAVYYYKGKDYQIICERECGYQSMMFETKAEAIAAHNRVARAVRAAKKSEVK